jgi:type II secretory ATPase GspE/PulE/Tfp pilus assembly ATPase PilB-like protein
MSNNSEKISAKILQLINSLFNKKSEQVKNAEKIPLYDKELTQTQEAELLHKYSEIIKYKLISSKNDLEPGVRISPEMLKWCKAQPPGTILVLSNGVIITSVPGSRVVQNCKAIMLREGLRPERVLGATNEFIQVFLQEREADNESYESSKEIITSQQQRLRLLVKEALQNDASDIHIEVRTDIAKIRFRKNGELYLHGEWLPRIAREIASICFNKETDYSVTHFNPLVPQNASMPLLIEGKNVRLRLASMPAHGGFDIVLRILTTGEVEESMLNLMQLGYTKEQLAIIQKAVKMPHGAVIISGPTGSGKTTTLASCLNMFATDRKLYTIEDPVEKVVEKATQVPVNEEQEDRSFASLGRATLRMDPDVIVLGEIRDVDTAAVMVRASMTGHLVFSTLHTNTATGIVTRLVDMGISVNLLSDTNLLVCLISQRLMPTLCNVCALPIMKSTEHSKHIDYFQKILGDLSTVRVRGKYCPECQGSGISGRTVIAEVVWIDEVSRAFIRNNDILGWEKYLKEQGWQSYSIHAVNLVKQGKCDPLDAERAIGSLDLAFRAVSFDYSKVKG